MCGTDQSVSNRQNPDSNSRTRSAAQTTADTKATVFRRWIFRWRWLIALAAPLAASIIILFVASYLQWSELLKLGLLQPSVAALWSLTAVLTMRLMLGRFAHERRKDAKSASSAAIAVRLWALCFSLLTGAMLLWSLIARLPDEFTLTTAKPQKEVEARLEVKPAAGAPTITSSIKVKQ